MTASLLTTQCPSCQQTLQISLPQLAQARGRAVCGHCHASFDALARLDVATSAAGAGLRQAHPVSNELPLLAVVPAQASAPAAAGQVERPISRAVNAGPIIPLPPPEPATVTAPAAAVTVAASALLRQPAPETDPPSRTFVPNFVRHASPAMRRRWWLGLAIITLLILLGGGWLLRRPLARTTLAGPGMAWFCALSGCHLPTISDPRRLRLLARDVRADAQHPGQLAVNLSLRNTAWFSQPYPVVQVQLQGRDGQLLATQRFVPSQYLGHRPPDAGGIQPGAELTISLQMDDPGTTASSFSLSFQ